MSRMFGNPKSEDFGTELMVWSGGNLAQEEDSAESTTTQSAPAETKLSETKGLSSELISSKPTTDTPWWDVTAAARNGFELVPYSMQKELDEPFTFSLGFNYFYVGQFHKAAPLLKSAAFNFKYPPAFIYLAQIDNFSGITTKKRLGHSKEHQAWFETAANINPLGQYYLAEWKAMFISFAILGQENFYQNFFPAADAGLIIARVKYLDKNFPNYSKQELDWLRDAAKQYNPKALLYLGSLFDQDIVSLEDAVKFFTLASQQGCAAASEKLAGIYTGELPQTQAIQNNKKVIQWYETAAAQTSYTSCVYYFPIIASVKQNSNPINLERFYLACKAEKNTAVYFKVMSELPLSLIEKRQWYLAAIKHGDETAKLGLGKIYYDLTLVDLKKPNNSEPLLLQRKIDLKKHLNWNDRKLLIEAAHLNYPQAQYALSVQLFKDNNGSAAIKWLEMAAAQYEWDGYSDSIKLLAEKYNSESALADPSRFYVLCKNHSNITPFMELFKQITNHNLKHNFSEAACEQGNPYARLNGTKFLFQSAATMLSSWHRVQDLLISVQRLTDKDTSFHREAIEVQKANEQNQPQTHPQLLFKGINCVEVKSGTVKRISYDQALAINLSNNYSPLRLLGTLIAHNNFLVAQNKSPLPPAVFCIITEYLLPLRQNHQNAINLQIMEKIRRREKIKGAPISVDPTLADEVSEIYPYIVFNKYRSDLIERLTEYAKTDASLNIWVQAYSHAHSDPKYFLELLHKHFEKLSKSNTPIKKTIEKCIALVSDEESFQRFFENSSSQSSSITTSLGS